MPLPDPCRTLIQAPRLQTPELDWNTRHTRNTRPIMALHHTRLGWPFGYEDICGGRTDVIICFYTFFSREVVTPCEVVVGGFLLKHDDSGCICFMRLLFGFGPATIELSLLLLSYIHTKHNQLLIVHNLTICDAYQYPKSKLRVHIKIHLLDVSNPKSWTYQIFRTLYVCEHRCITFVALYSVTFIKHSMLNGIFSFTVFAMMSRF